MTAELREAWGHGVVIFSGFFHFSLMMQSPNLKKIVLCWYVFKMININNFKEDIYKVFQL